MISVHESNFEVFADAFNKVTKDLVYMRGARISINGANTDHPYFNIDVRNPEVWEDGFHETNTIYLPKNLKVTLDYYDNNMVFDILSAEYEYLNMEWAEDIHTFNLSISQKSVFLGVFYNDIIPRVRCGVTLLFNPKAKKPIPNGKPFFL